MKPYAIPTRFHCTGNHVAGRQLIGLGRTQLNILRKQMSFQNLQTHHRTVCFQNGTVIECYQTKNLSEVRIHVPLSGGVKQKSFGRECFCIPCFTLAKVVGYTYKNMETITRQQMVESEYFAFVDVLVCNHKGCPEGDFYTLIEGVQPANAEVPYIGQMVLLAGLDDNENTCATSRWCPGDKSSDLDVLTLTCLRVPPSTDKEWWNYCKNGERAFVGPSSALPLESTTWSLTGGPLDQDGNETDPYQVGIEVPLEVLQECKPVQAEVLGFTDEDKGNNRVTLEYNGETFFNVPLFLPTDKGLRGRELAGVPLPTPDRAFDESSLIFHKKTKVKALLWEPSDPASGQKDILGVIALLDSLRASNSYAPCHWPYMVIGKDYGMASLGEGRWDVYNLSTLTAAQYPDHENDALITLTNISNNDQSRMAIVNHFLNTDESILGPMVLATPDYDVIGTNFGPATSHTSTIRLYEEPLLYPSFRREETGAYILSLGDAVSANGDDDDKTFSLYSYMPSRSSLGKTIEVSVYGVGIPESYTSSTDHDESIIGDWDYHLNTLLCLPDPGFVSAIGGVDNLHFGYFLALDTPLFGDMTGETITVTESGKSTFEALTQVHGVPGDPMETLWYSLEKTSTVTVNYSLTVGGLGLSFNAQRTNRLHSICQYSYHGALTASSYSWQSIGSGYRTIEGGLWLCHQSEDQEENSIFLGFGYEIMRYSVAMYTNSATTETVDAILQYSMSTHAEVRVSDGQGRWLDTHKNAIKGLIENTFGLFDYDIGDWEAYGYNVVAPLFTCQVSVHSYSPEELSLFYSKGTWI